MLNILTNFKLTRNIPTTFDLLYKAFTLNFIICFNLNMVEIFRHNILRKFVLEDLSVFDYQPSFIFKIFFRRSVGFSFPFPVDGYAVVPML